ncbi:MAG: DUF3592 domain-containing protein [Anaerolineae bacterium]|nr:DUF3592 domain-containing protein [Anaerolineae bacterium]
MNALLLLLFLLIAGVISIGLYMLLTAVLSRLNAKALTQRGIATQATITAVKEKQLPRGLLACGISYRFHVVTSSGTTREYVSQEAVDAEAYKHLKVGDVIWVHYLPDHPQVVRRTEALARMPGRKIGE